GYSAACGARSSGSAAIDLDALAHKLGLRLVGLAASLGTYDGLDAIDRAIYLGTLDGGAAPQALPPAAEEALGVRLAAAAIEDAGFTQGAAVSVLAATSAADGDLAARIRAAWAFSARSLNLAVDEVACFGALQRAEE